MHRRSDHRHKSFLQAGTQLKTRASVSAEATMVTALKVASSLLFHLPTGLNKLCTSCCMWPSWFHLNFRCHLSMSFTCGNEPHCANCPAGRGDATTPSPATSK